MEITLIGWILIPIGVLLLYINQKLLYKLMVFLIPFSATAVVNVGVASEGSGIQAYIYVGSLLILNYFIKFIITGKIKYSRAQKVSILLLLIFLLIVFLSLIMPLIINGDLQIISPELNNFEVTPLLFNIRHVTQFIYLLYGVLLTIIIAIRNTQERYLLESLKTYILSGLFVCLWGILQLVLYKLNIPYPDFIFNNSITKSAVGYLQEDSELEIKRISSVTVEPSVYAQFVLTVIPLVFFAKLVNIQIISRWVDNIILSIMLLSLLISTSSTAYIGLILFIIITMIVLMYHRIISSFYLMFVIILMFGCIMLYLSNTMIADIIDIYVINKMTSYSAMERLTTVYYAWEYFLQYPILGVGWGSVTSHDLIMKLLANTGILGLGSFMIFIYYVIIKLSKFTINLKPNQTEFYYANAILISLILLLFINMLTGFSFVFGHFWFILGIAIAIFTQRKDCNAPR